MIPPYEFKDTCNIHNAIDKSKFITDKFKKIHGELYNYELVNYTSNKNKVKIICKKHGIFEQTPNNHLSGNGCITCINSSGENFIRQFLIKNNISFIPQKRFNNCRYKNPLIFDFYLPELNTCIEYNGKQHYKCIEYFGGDNVLKLQQIKDKIKIEYCYKNNIPLLIIKYDEDIKEKLNNHFNQKLYIQPHP